MKKWFTILLAVLMLCALVGCKDTKPDGKDTPTTTTTTPTKPNIAPLTLVEGDAPEGSYRYVDYAAVSTNETVVLKANVDLTDLCLLRLGADTPVVEHTQLVQSSLNAGEYWAIETYINDTIPTRGIACTDESGKTYYYAITWSGKDGSISLTALDIEVLSEKKLVEIQAFLIDEENNGFVSFNEYDSPEEVSLPDALHDIGVPHEDWTEEDVVTYLNAIGETDRDTAFQLVIHRHDRAETEALLQEKLGLSITLTEDNMKMRYIEELDAFFDSHTDSLYSPVHVLHGWREGDLYVVDYELGYMGNTGRVILKSTEDGYQFVSNRYTEPLSENTIYQLTPRLRDEIEAFLNDKKNNGFVTTTYSRPEEISLSWALYDGAGIGVGSWEWTDEEVQDYMAAAGWAEMYTSATRFARSDVEALLQKKLGISLTDLTTDVDMLYMEKYDAYYHAHSDTQGQLIEVEDGYLSGNRYVVHYKTRQSESFPYKYRTVILWIVKDGYQFAYNQ